MREAFRHHIPISKVKCFCYSALFTIFGILIPALVLLDTRPRANLTFLGKLLQRISPALILVLILAFGFLVTMLLLKIFDSKAGLLITDEGLYNNSTILGGDYVKWSEVSSIRLTTTKTNKQRIHHIEVHANRKDGFSTIRVSWLRRLIMRKDMFSSGCMIVRISKQTLEATYGQIVAALRTHQNAPIIDEREYS
jgi:hypothetical protein